MSHNPQKCINYIVFFLFQSDRQAALREMAKVIISNTRMVHMARRAMLDESSSSDEDKDDSDEQSDTDVDDESDCDYVHDQTDDPGAANADPQYSMVEYDDHIEIVSREEHGENHSVSGNDLQDDHDPSLHDSIVQGRQKRRHRFKRRRLFEYLDEVETYEEEFKEVFRMSRRTFREVDLPYCLLLY